MGDVETDVTDLRTTPLNMIGGSEVDDLLRRLLPGALP
jgi:hypothetical protein